ncbi:Gamma-tubulin complex component [Gryllus bimaculatus]|nr:Gamma-tubulin complex component [Gryllus bimaculatus]
MAGRAKDLIAADVQKLITLLSGFSEKEDPENFELCEKFAYSNLLHHRYLSVDSHAVRRSVFGMVTKFMIHGHLEASRRLDCLLNKYMNCTVFKDKEVQWAVLFLLVKLADNPTSHISDEKFSAPKVEETEDASKPFDWTTYSHLCDYLKEGNEEFNTNFCSSDSEDWEDVSDDEKSPKPEDSVEGVSEDPEVPKVPAVEEKKDTERQQLIEELGRQVNAEEWISNNVQAPWWRTKQLAEKVESVFPSANLAKTWDKCCDESTSTISEYKVVREILWMLQAPTTTTLFQEVNGQFSIQSNITIPSLTKDSMACYLNPLCEYFNMLYQLQKFQKEIYPLDRQNSGELNQMLPPYTFECYTSAIIEFLRELQELACCIEKKVKAQEDIYTLYSLNLELAPKLSQLRAVYSVHVTATNGWKTAENWLSSARLLSVLYSEALSCMECDTPCILLRVFLKSFGPYVDMIDVWLTEGRLDDYRNEFIITRRNETDNENWGSNFVMRDYVTELNSTGIRALPLLQVISDRVLHAGRSMQLLQQLDRLDDMRSQHSNHGRMYAEFLEALEKEIAQMVNKSTTTDMEIVAVTEDLEFQGTNLISNPFISEVTNQLENLKDNYMMQAFKDHLSFKAQPNKRDIENLSSIGEVFRKLGTYSTCGLIPIKPVMERIISQLIDAKHAAACFLAKTIFLQEFNLSTHLALLRAIYLMEAGDIMHRFCIFLFKDAEHSVFWSNSYTMTAELEECINLRYPDHSSKFSVVVREDAKLNGTPSVMDEINIKYTVEWPLTVILSPTNMEYYNAVFQFLLKVKWALWALEALRFSDLTTVKNNTSTTEDAGLRCRARCLQLLRFWLLHSVGSVHTYLMGQVLHSLGLELERDLAAATDLDTLLQAHNRYVALVHTHCLQPKSSDVIKTAILQMVQLSLELRDLWCLGVDVVSDAKLIGMTEMYIKCHCFLGSVLQTAVESNRLTHLNGLSMALNTSLPKIESFALQF